MGSVERGVQPARGSCAKACKRDATIPAMSALRAAAVALLLIALPSRARGTEQSGVRILPATEVTLTVLRGTETFEATVPIAVLVP